MTYLTLLLIVKITTMFLFVAVPFLLLPVKRLEAAMRITAHSPMLLRLYGIAILALLVGYTSGIPVAQAGKFPWGIVVMGIVSNTGAAAILILSAGSATNRLAGVFFATIAIGLLTCAAIPASALNTVL